MLEMQQKISKILLFFVISVIVELAFADDFLENCPIDGALHVDNDRVIDVLKTFYNDLSFVQASSESRQVRDYSTIIGEMRNEVSSLEMRYKMQIAVDLLTGNKASEASLKLTSALNSHRDLDSAGSYLHYFKAETQRILGLPVNAFKEILQATVIREQSTGVSVNELEKLDGLVTIQRVSEFNQEVDKLYEVGAGPDYEHIQSAHQTFGNSLNPFLERRSAELARMFEERSTPRNKLITMVIEKSLAPSRRTYRRINPDQDDFSGQSVAKTSVKGILYEFAQKLAILGASSPRKEESANSTDNPSKYYSLVDQLRQLDEAFAIHFYNKVVVPYENGDQMTALLSLVNFWDFYESSNSASIERSIDRPHGARYEYGKSLETFTKYFRVEIYRRTQDCKHLKEIEYLLESIKLFRHKYKGISSGKILELEGKVVLLSLKCFHARLRSAYLLNGNESDQELEVIRTQLGKCGTILSKPS